MANALSQADGIVLAAATDLAEMTDKDLREYFGISRTRDAKVAAFEEARGLLGQLIDIIDGNRG